MRRRYFGAATTTLLCLWIGLACAGPALAAIPIENSARASDGGDGPKRLRRSESFFGLHFDLHAQASDDRIGENVTPKMVENIVDKIKPDYIQVDCKGHPGISSYPTKVGNPAAGFVRDQLKIWRDVTARRGVALYMHYSGVWDQAAVTANAAWARIDEKGKRDWRLTSVFGPYVDELLIPQLKELRDVYRVDGVWVDGECWAVAYDYSKAAIGAFREKTGVTEVPRKPADLHYAEFTEFCREGFRRYFNHYVTALHEHDPGFQICGNWAFSSFMPEPVSIDVDFLSGDFSPNDGVNSARFEGRCLRSQTEYCRAGGDRAGAGQVGWDLMAWSFYRSDGGCRSTKSATQLQQEAAVVLALGGGFQAYFKQKRDCSIYDWQVDIMRGVAEFCRARQQFCHKAEPVPQVALLYSGKATYRNATRLFGSWGELLTPLKGVLRALLNSQYSVEILMEHHLKGRMHGYPLIVVPEWDFLEEGFRKELVEYVADGGNLLLIGPEAAALFRNQLGVSFEGPAEVRNRWIEHNGRLAGIKTLHQSVRIKSDARPFGKLYSENDVKNSPEIAASIAGYGRGKIAATYFDFGERYQHAGTDVARDFLNSLVRTLFPEPIVEVTGSHYVDVTVNRIGGRLAVNLVNTAGPHADNNVYVFSDIPQVGPLEITIRSKTRPRKLTLQPKGEAIRYRYN
ncbi:MAG: hypothetical protein JSU70_15730, partial [Phycisphaerales bacterium]